MFTKLPNASCETGLERDVSRAKWCCEASFRTRVLRRQSFEYFWRREDAYAENQVESHNGGA